MLSEEITTWDRTGTVGVGHRTGNEGESGISEELGPTVGVVLNSDRVTLLSGSCGL